MNRQTQTFDNIFPSLCEGDEIARMAWKDSSVIDVVYLDIKIDGEPQARIRLNDGQSCEWTPGQVELFADDWYAVN